MPYTDLKSRNMIALSNISCFIDASSKLFSVALRGYTYEGGQFIIRVITSYLAQKDLEMRATNVRQTLIDLKSRKTNDCSLK